MLRKMVPGFVKTYLKNASGHGQLNHCKQVVLPSYHGLGWYTANVSRHYPEPDLARPASQTCTMSQVASPCFAEWCARLNHRIQKHRKLWEWVYIAHSLDHMGALQPGHRGLGFGVGKERLISYFASRGCSILATDIDYEQARASGWVDTDQYSLNKQDLNGFGLCPEGDFDRLVDYRNMDMREIDEGLRDYDFVWSSCAFEHLGSPEAGLDFVMNSMDCLKPSGVGVHTTELNVSSADETLDSGHTILYRKCDLESLAARLEADGHQVEPLNFNAGSDPVDFDVYHPGVEVMHTKENHLKLGVGKFVTSSFGLIVRKKA